MLRLAAHRETAKRLVNAPSARAFTSSLMALQKHPAVVVPSALRLKQLQLQCFLAVRAQSTEPFLQGDSSPYIDRMYEHWRQDPKSVHASWDAYFRSVDVNAPGQLAFTPPPPLSQGQPRSQTASTSKEAAQSAHDTSRVIELVRGYQTRGHEFAKVDPLGLPHEFPYVTAARLEGRKQPLGYKSFGFTESDLDRLVDYRVPGLTGFLSADRQPMTLRQLLQRLEETYCHHIGIEAGHIEDPKVTNYLRQIVEGESKYEFSKDMKTRILVRTARAQLFEQFCAQKFTTAKRFGVDGCETAIVMLKGIAKKAVAMGVDSIVMGMPHRGRLNTLVNVFHKPMEKMMKEFQGLTGFDSQAEWGNTGDVKYHMGMDYDHFDEERKTWVHMALLSNPSHLEVVDPFVAGQARAQQYYSGDAERVRVLPVMLHGDASFAGQGVVYETVQMSKLPNYTVGGSIHIVVNNQVGFTSNVVDQGSGRYCTDLAKCIDAPIFHVNADDPEACTYVAELALEYRQKFHSDVFINLVGYRRFGHNELDMPKFTQPQMYDLVASHPPVFDKYAQKLIDEGVVTKEYVEKLKKDTFDYYNKEYEASKNVPPPDAKQHLEYRPQWKHMARPGESAPAPPTGVEMERLKDLGRAISVLPDGFNPHPTIGKVYKSRAEAIETGENIDFGQAEALAFGTLLGDGFHVRLSGQDVQRGTFSHRHAVVHDQTVFKTVCPLNELVKSRGYKHNIAVANSLLSEMACLGFEVGYSLEHPDTLAIWEAQFGDFANGAQVVVDQFISSGETKWGSQCGIVMNLPHGYDGQGPEHSSGRIERYLQLCDDREDVFPDAPGAAKRDPLQCHNMQVAYCSTPANWFHLLRRQMHSGFRKPLIHFASKRILKMRAAFSNLAEFGEGTSFVPYFPNSGTNGSAQSHQPSSSSNHLPVDESIERLILCSGQLYYDLVAYREKHGLWNVGIARVEQLSPFPFTHVADDLKRYPSLRDVVWAQEEPMNQGMWGYTSRRVVTCLEHLGRPNGISSPIYAGRDASAATACGDAKVHQKELDNLLRDAFDLNRSANSYIEKYIPLGGSGKSSASATA